MIYTEKTEIRKLIDTGKMTRNTITQYLDLETYIEESEYINDCFINKEYRDALAKIETGELTAQNYKMEVSPECQKIYDKNFRSAFEYIDMKK